MSVTPLFLDSMTTLKSKLRLSGASAADALAMLDTIVEEVRIGFYLRLTQARITTILATAYAANPTTDAGYLRALANATEVLWCRLKALRLFPTLIAEGAGNKLQSWNDEGVFRPQGQSDLAAEFTRLETELENNLEILAGEQTSGDVRTIQTFDGTPDETPDLPGATIFPNFRGGD